MSRLKDPSLHFTFDTSEVGIDLNTTISDDLISRPQVEEGDVNIHLKEHFTGQVAGAIVKSFLDMFPPEANCSTSDPALRIAIYKAFGGCCFYTHEPVEFSDMEIDHIWPASKGGPDNIYNYCLTSVSRNRRKLNTLDMERLQPTLYYVASRYAGKVLEILKEDEASKAPELIKKHKRIRVKDRLPETEKEERSLHKSMLEYARVPLHDFPLFVSHDKAVDSSSPFSYRDTLYPEGRSGKPVMRELSLEMETDESYPTAADFRRLILLIAAGKEVDSYSKEVLPTTIYRAQKYKHDLLGLPENLKATHSGTDYIGYNQLIERYKGLRVSYFEYTGDEVTYAKNFGVIKSYSSKEGALVLDSTLSDHLELLMPPDMPLYLYDNSTVHARFSIFLAHRFKMRRVWEFNVDELWRNYLGSPRKPGSKSASNMAERLQTLVKGQVVQPVSLKDSFTGRGRKRTIRLEAGKGFR